MQPHLASFVPLAPAMVRIAPLDAALVGSTDTAILRFSGVLETVGTAIAVTTTAALGTQVAITERGLYRASLIAYTNAADGTAFGVSKNATGAALTGVPTIGTTGMLEAGVVVPNAAEVPLIKLGVDFYVSQAEAAVAGGAIVRFHALDDGGTPPGELVLGSVLAVVTRVADWPA